MALASVVRVCAAVVAAALLLYLGFSTLLLHHLVFPPHRPQFPSSSQHDVLADFYDRLRIPQDHPTHGPRSSFFFGLASAPAHVEDGLEDAWLDFAKLERRPVASWHNVPAPEQRLRFWSEPEVEIQLVKESGVTMLRFGVDWGRIVPVEPLNGTAACADNEAVHRYVYILEKARSHGLRIMLTLFHHSLPKWALGYGGWTDRRTITYFVDFVTFARSKFGHLVDYWITFNEPHIFVLLSHCSGTWPGAKKLSTIQSLICSSPFGEFGKAMNAIIEAHKLAYVALHEAGSKEDDAPVGVAHHVGVIRPYGLFDVPIVVFARWLTQYHWIDHIKRYLDFCGLNYYGQEVLSMAGLILDSEEEYSEAGRGVYPDGFYELLLAFHERYKLAGPDQRPLRYIITENGMADARDILRRPYLIEHLLALSAAMRAGVPVDGYLHWTISDNWEWADGYCPKFGLVDVDRAGNLTRRRRPSYYLYKQIAESGIITEQQRHAEWESLQQDMRSGGLRPFCRHGDRFGRMWAESLDTPTTRPISERDWRVGHHQTHSVLTYAARSLKVGRILLSDAASLLFGGIYADVAMPSELRAGEL